jgi:1-acyl-sn-glycerol-3-phosphate acyltransferase
VVLASQFALCIQKPPDLEPHFAAAFACAVAFFCFPQPWDFGTWRGVGICGAGTAGLEHLPKTPCVLLPLHEGLFDVVAMLHLPCKMRFAARSELLSWQFLGGLLRHAGVIEVNPEQPVSSYRRLLRQTPNLLAAGESLVIFPQGSVCGLEIDFQQSAFALAKKFGLPIVPVVLTGSHRVWDHPFSPKVRLGQPIALRLLEPVFAPNPTALKRQMKQLALESSATPRRYAPSRDGYWDEYRLEIDPDFVAVWADVHEHRQKGLF